MSYVEWLNEVLGYLCNEQGQPLTIFKATLDHETMEFEEFISDVEVAFHKLRGPEPRECFEENDNAPPMRRAADYAVFLTDEWKLYGPGGCNA